MRRLTLTTACAKLRKQCEPYGEAMIGLSLACRHAAARQRLPFNDVAALRPRQPRRSLRTIGGCAVHTTCEHVFREVLVHRTGELPARLLTTLQYRGDI